MKKQLDELLQEVATIFNVEATALRSVRRKRLYSEPRHAFCLKAHQEGYKDFQISTFLGMDRSSIVYCRQQAQRLMDVDGDYRTKCRAA